MYTAIGLLILAICCTSIWWISLKIINDKPKLMMIGFITGALMATIVCVFYVKTNIIKEERTTCGNI